MKQMNPKWAKSTYSDIDSSNEHCVAWLCDPEQWANYKVEGVAKYAIGSPSVEMYMKAFNVYKGTNNTLINKIENSSGYLVGHDDTYVYNGYRTGYVLEAGPNNLFMENAKLYFWLASPAGQGGAYVLKVMANVSEIGSYTLNGTVGTKRPVIALL